MFYFRPFLSPSPSRNDSLFLSELAISILVTLYIWSWIDRFDNLNFYDQPLFFLTSFSTFVDGLRTNVEFQFIVNH